MRSSGQPGRSSPSLSSPQNHDLAGEPRPRAGLCRCPALRPPGQRARSAPPAPPGSLTLPKILSVFVPLLELPIFPASKPGESASEMKSIISGVHRSAGLMEQWWDPEEPPRAKGSSPSPWPRFSSCRDISSGVLRRRQRSRVSPARLCLDVPQGCSKAVQGRAKLCL